MPLDMHVLSFAPPQLAVVLDDDDARSVGSSRILPMGFKPFLV